MSSTPPQDRRPQRIAVVPGDGIGKDVSAEAVKVLEAARQRFGLPIELEHFPWSADHYLATGVTMPPDQLALWQADYAAIFMGAFGDARVPDMKHAADILLGTRFGLDLFINFRPVKLYDERLCPLKDKTCAQVDFVVFRENTEGAYVNVGGTFKKGTPDEVAVQEEIHTRKGVERIIRAAFEYARAHGKTKVCMSDKSNVMQHAHGLWQRVFKEVAAEYPEITPQHLFVDALCLLLVREPESFQVIVTNNMFGDIVTDLAAALQGGLGVAASGNTHPGRVSMYEPVHGSGPKLAGTGKANPVGAILTCALMLQDLGHREAADAIERAVAASLRARQCTEDVGGTWTTSAVGDLLAKAVAGT